MLAKRIARACVAGLVACVPVQAEVVDSSPSGFVVRNSVVVAAPREKVYDALVRDVGRWWDREHTYSRDAGNLSIDPRPGGCFCERLPDKGGVQHMTVVNVAPGRTLRLSGGLGPLQELAVTGSMTWALTDGADGTVITMTYAVAGYRKDGMGTLAAPVDGVLGSQLQRLKRYVERGAPQ